LPVGLSICEDFGRRAADRATTVSQNPIQDLSTAGAQVMINASASRSGWAGKHDFESSVGRAGEAIWSAAGLCDQVGGNDELVFGGNSVSSTRRGTHRQREGF